MQKRDDLQVWKSAKMCGHIYYAQWKADTCLSVVKNFMWLKYAPSGFVLPFEFGLGWSSAYSCAG